jgi:hypothetical protein
MKIPLKLKYNAYFSVSGNGLQYVFPRFEIGRYSVVAEFVLFGKSGKK